MKPVPETGLQYPSRSALSSRVAFSGKLVIVFPFKQHTGCVLLVREQYDPREVARRAGVSLATVSRVLNNTQYISEETRRSVLATAGSIFFS